MKNVDRTDIVKVEIPIGDIVADKLKAVGFKFDSKADNEDIRKYSTQFLHKFSARIAYEYKLDKSYKVTANAITLVSKTDDFVSRICLIIVDEIMERNPKFIERIAFEVLSNMKKRGGKISTEIRGMAFSGVSEKLVKTLEGLNYNFVLS